MAYRQQFEFSLIPWHGRGSRFDPDDVLFDNHLRPGAGKKSTAPVRTGTDALVRQNSGGSKGVYPGTKTHNESVFEGGNWSSVQPPVQALYGVRDRIGGPDRLRGQKVCDFD